MVAFFGGEVYIYKVVPSGGRFANAIELEVLERMARKVGKVLLGVLSADDRE